MAFAQCCNDKKRLVYEVLNTELNSLDSRLKMTYYLNEKSFTSYEREYRRLTGKSRFERDSVYRKKLCNKVKWGQEYITSLLAIVYPDPVKHYREPDRSCFISTPIFNKDFTKCKVYVSVSLGEFVASGRFIYFEKRDGKWIRTNSSLVWIT